ncbi:glycosyltransferase [Hymenobacter wooponensis]|uniref:Glycosyltransferase n=1 Tax=Hymenobacter wooponensis TaxID=1525360 RepID=A0A4Z0MT47_9BACT|nr:glycosyltransferase [Hymenobacter wooponensis]TGD82993.1 glycosyltransferase [Hymenobacter wooponensis]
MSFNRVVVSIIIPCYNHGAYIQEAISSIEQNAGDLAYEIIIVDDGSTDELTKTKIKELATQKYKVIQQPNAGLAAARNNGIALAKGKYILPLDSDNRLHANYLTKAVAILDDDSSIDVVYGNSVFFGENDGVRNVGNNYVGEFDFNRMVDCNYIDACAIYKKSMWEKAGGYDGNMPAMGHEDWELWVNMFLLGGRFYFLDELCFYYRVTIGSMLVTNVDNKHELNKEYIYKKHSYKIVSHLLHDSNKFNYINKHKAKAIVKLLLGRGL